MLTPYINYITCHNEFEAYRMYYTCFGTQETATKTLLCVHGLNRNSRDFDYIGQYFAARGYFVISPDIVGRGNSAHLTNAKGYDISYYVNDVMHLIASLQLMNIAYIGTSMGGVIGMAIAGANGSKLINKLILNDIGAEIELRGLKRIMAYSVTQEQYKSYAQAKDALITTSKNFGDLPHAIWEFMARTSMQKNVDGYYVEKRDVNLVNNFNLAVDANVELWDSWRNVQLPTLIVRGSDSDILSSTTVAKMQQINKHTQCVEIANTGHAPFLYTDEHCVILNKFLRTC